MSALTQTGEKGRCSALKKYKPEKCSVLINEEEEEERLITS